jgi:hypothetical protein
MALIPYGELNERSVQCPVPEAFGKDSLTRFHLHRILILEAMPPPSPVSTRPGKPRRPLLEGG